MDTIIVGGLIRVVQGLASAAPTLLIGLFIASLLRYYIGAEGTRRFFGGETLKSLPQAWLIGMLLPVCSIGVIPILREMKRVGIRPGAITAFALAAPLFNPLSLLYGLTLSRPFVIIGFAIASLAVVTLLGIIWDYFARSSTQPTSDFGTSAESENLIGFKRVVACFVFSVREICGPSGLLALIAVAGLWLLGAALPHGALQSSVEQLDPLAPLRMTLVAIPVYATPMLAMSQLGMMFAHGNSPGASFCLLILGTGMNLATIVWIAKNYGVRSTSIWITTLVLIVVVFAYAVEKPLIPPGVEPAGHTHAFDIYTNPLHGGNGVNFTKVREELAKTIGLPERISLAGLGLFFLIGLCVQSLGGDKVDQFVRRPKKSSSKTLDREVSPRLVGLTVIVGLIALSVVGCYAYYPSPEETLEEMRMVKAEVLSATTSGDYERALQWIPQWDEWSRRLEVGTVIRRFELRPYQRAQTHLLRKKLELLEHELEHMFEEQKAELLGSAKHDSAKHDSAEHDSTEHDSAEHEAEEAEIRQLVAGLGSTSLRVSKAFQRVD